MNRDPEAVARAHIHAVEQGDPATMAADYADDAVLDRGDEVHHGRTAIEAYFATVPGRLGDARVVFDSLTVDGDTATFSWHLEGTPTPVSGTDVCVVRGGLIVSQVVHLDASDF